MIRAISRSLLVALCVLSGSAFASGPKMFCAFDPVGANGFIYQLLQSYRLDAMRAGVALTMRPYTDEDELVRAFEAGDCDMIAATDMGARLYNQFTGSISAIGAIPNYDDLRVLLHILGSSRVAQHMETNTHQILGVTPMGGAYLFVNDRTIDRVERLEGQRITILAGHHDARHMAEYVGMIPVDATVANFARLFNEGQADVSYAPAAAYETLEMFNGIGDTGGIIRFPIGQITIQLVARKGEFDDAFVRQSRRIMSRLYNESMRITRQFETDIPAHLWVDIPEEAMNEYFEMLRQVRIDISRGETREQLLAADSYHEEMLTILRKVRCYNNPISQECAAADRE